jgi:hypothetical protein
MKNHWVPMWEIVCPLYITVAHTILSKYLHTNVIRKAEKLSPGGNLRLIFITPKWPTFLRNWICFVLSLGKQIRNKIGFPSCGKLLICVKFIFYFSVKNLDHFNRTNWALLEMMAFLAFLQYLKMLFHFPKFLLR